MGRSQETFNKKEVRNKKEKRKKEKQEKREARKEQKKSGSLEDMLAYVDENGNITDTPPDPTKKKEVKLENINISTPKRESIEDGEVQRKGKVTFYNVEKGFGFIKDTLTEESVFVHINNVDAEELKENNLVNFEVEMGPKGPTAVKVTLDK